MRPVVVVTVFGGVADTQVMPPGSDQVQYLHIDWDNLQDGDDPPSKEYIQTLMEEVAVLPGDGESAVQYRKTLTDDLQKILDKL